MQIRSVFLWGQALFLGVWAQAVAVDSIPKDSIPAVDSTGINAQLTQAVSVDTLAERLVRDSIRTQWLTHWVGTDTLVRFPKKTFVWGEYNPQTHRLPVSGKVQSGLFDFSFSGEISLDDSTQMRLRKAKDYKCVVEYHARTVQLAPKKRDKRLILIDRISLEFESEQRPLLGEIWLGAKTVKSAGYKAWRDSLVEQGVLTSARRGFVLDSRDQQNIPWLQFDSLQWFSRYLSWDFPGSYSCTMENASSACRRYDIEDAPSLCPAGWSIPNTTERQALLHAWVGESGLPFFFGLRIWEISPADSTENPGAVMLYAPWTDSARIEPNFWSYYETYGTDSLGQIGVFRFGWDSLGVMTSWETDPNDHVHHPVRCARMLNGEEPVASQVNTVPVDTMPIPLRTFPEPGIEDATPLDSVP